MNIEQAKTELRKLANQMPFSKKNVFRDILNAVEAIDSEQVKRQSSSACSADLRQQKLRRIILDKTSQVGDYEKMKGWLRYEAMRKLNMRQVSDLNTRSLHGERLDDMIDDTVIEQNV